MEVRQLERHGDTQHSRIFSFPCGRWLARDEDDHEIVRELVPAMETVVNENTDLGQLKVHSVKRGDTLSSELTYSVYCSSKTISACCV